MQRQQQLRQRMQPLHQRRTLQLCACSWRVRGETCQCFETNETEMHVFRRESCLSGKRAHGGQTTKAQTAQASSVKGAQLLRKSSSIKAESPKAFHMSNSSGILCTIFSPVA